jgi:hypothetical protein
MKEEDYNKMVYDNFVKTQKEQGTWIDREKAFDEQMKLLSKRLTSTEKKSKQIPLTEEQISKNKEYWEKVHSLNYKEPKPIIKPRQQIDLKVAKMMVHSSLTGITKERGETLVIDDNNREALTQLTMYFSNNPDFNGDLKKGILLCGGVGTGKTLMMEIFSCFSRDTMFEIEDMKKIARDAQVNGVEVLSEYTQGIKCYDDVGFETISVNYGNKICMFTELVNVNYNKFQKTGKISHITTNLGFETDFGFGYFKDKYDIRVFDRVKQMYNVITIHGDSKRK